VAMTLIQSLRRSFRGAAHTTSASSVVAPVEPVRPVGSGPEVEIQPNDPLFALLQAARGPLDIASVDVDSAALRALRAAGVVLVVPLVSQGELIGTINLGPRLSEQDYSSDDRRLLASLAAQAAPAVRVAQLVQEQAAELQARERYEQELRVATLIQQQFLPRELPKLADWQVAAFYGPARAVGGDFYDFIELPDGRIGVVVGDVTDKGVPAALIMARTHSILRGDAPRLVSPARVLAHANELLVAEMPERMFVTCLYLVFDPQTGHVVFANAGHNLPYVRTADGVTELRATGMPLGLMSGIVYEEVEADVAPGANLLLYSDGLVEAHDPAGAMYGFPRLREALRSELVGSDLIDGLLDGLHAFTGRGWEQEDDITLVTIRRSRVGEEPGPDLADVPSGTTTLLELELPGQPGNERLAMDRVAEAVGDVGLEPDRLERLKTAVSETAMNAIEYGSGGSPDVPIEIVVTRGAADLRVAISDHALGGAIPVDGAEEPDLDAKLEGLQKPRGWGMFLVRHMVDRVEITPGTDRQTVTLIVDLGGAPDANSPV
jgi:serine phosphatase RsbU (regulator of sigma subunit)/anti-sigma regulatory factor (Ser/Thr protein kinase)